jgi:hypothetical protein
VQPPHPTAIAARRTNDDMGGVMNLVGTAIRVTLLLSAAVGIAHRIGIADALW